MAEAFFSMKNIVKEYDMAGEKLRILKGIHLEVQRGEFLSILGPSGSGKSTLMNVIGCLDTPTSGEYWLEGENICRMNQHQLAQLRCHEIGFIFQSFQLLPRLTALQNVELPLIYAGVPGKQREEIAVQQLHHVGLHDRMTH